MREIKFRAWVLEEEEMYYSPEMQDWDGFDAWLRIDCEDNDIDEGSIKIMEFTGLKDKNGKEIYEGDVLSVIPYMEPIPNYRKQVTWIEDRFAWNLNVVDIYEVIGNIYENPELLDKK